MSYILILVSKSIENILSTLRILFISNHKKFLGALLNFIITLIWIFSTVFILRNITKEPLCAFIYALGCFIGSYIGSTIEEKLALGSSMLTIITKDDTNIHNKLRELGYDVTLIDGYGYNNKQKILFVMIPRKKKYKLYHLIKFIDNKASVISESASYIK